MVLAAVHPVTLDEFSQLPNIEESPAWEFLNGQVLQKPMPTFYHILSKNSVVPDITIIHQSRIPSSNEPIQGAPDWLIEILSIDQSTTKLISKIQTCLTEGSKLGWLIDSQEQVIMIFRPNHPFQLVSGDHPLICLDEMSLQLTANQVFGCLQR
jgi:Uma2 family endonuclease